MNNNKVFCYWEPVNGLPQFEHLLRQWAMSWRNHGWEPHILGRNHAWQHPHFKSFLMKVAVYPSINPKGYDETCWLRWLAFCAVGGGVMTDFDVMNVGYSPDNDQNKDGPPVILEKNRVPCVVSADSIGCAQIVADLMEPPRVALGTHYSDMIHFQASDYPAVDVCREIMHPGWEVAQLIHFSRHGCRQYRHSTNKSDIVTMVTKIP